MFTHQSTQSSCYTVSVSFHSSILAWTPPACSPRVSLTPILHCMSRVIKHMAMDMEELFQPLMYNVTHSRTCCNDNLRLLHLFQRLLLLCRQTQSAPACLENAQHHHTDLQSHRHPLLCRPFGLFPFFSFCRRSLRYSQSLSQGRGRRLIVQDRHLQRGLQGAFSKMHCT